MWSDLLGFLIHSLKVLSVFQLQNYRILYFTVFLSVCITLIGNINILMVGIKLNFLPNC